MILFRNSRGVVRNDEMVWTVEASGSWRKHAFYSRHRTLTLSRNLNNDGVWLHEILGASKFRGPPDRLHHCKVLVGPNKTYPFRNPEAKIAVDGRKSRKYPFQHADRLELQASAANRDKATWLIAVDQIVIQCFCMADGPLL